MLAAGANVKLLGAILVSFIAGFLSSTLFPTSGVQVSEPDFFILQANLKEEVPEPVVQERVVGVKEELSEQALVAKCEQLAKCNNLHPSPSTDLPRSKGVQVVFLPAMVLDNSTKTASDSEKPAETFVDGVTIVIPTYNREASLFKNTELEKYAAIEIVRSILISWNNPVETPSRKLLAYFGEERFQGKVTIAMQAQNSLLNRFRTDLIHTNAVLSLDDDRGISPKDVERLYAWWKLNPHRLVGGFVRKVECDEHIHCKYYHQGFKEFNLILPGGGCIAHVEHYERMWTAAAAPFRKYVHERMNCEDILFNLLLPKEDALKVHVHTMRATFNPGERDVGISTTPGHIFRRNACVEFFVKGGLAVPPMQDRSVHNSRITPGSMPQTNFGALE